MIPFSPLFIDSDFLLLLKIFNNYKLKKNEIITYSVRTSIHTYLKIKNYKPGSKILITSINIPTITNIIKYNNLEYIGVDLDLETLDMNKTDFMKKIDNEDIKCCIYSHLFGKINDINWVINECNKRNIDFIEDCAECYTPKYNGNINSDIICFSFGSIKKCTCFGGSKTIFKKKSDFNNFKKEIKKYKYQYNYEYILKIIKYFYISLLLNNKYLNLFVRKISYFFNIDINNKFINLIRNIDNKKLIQNISYQPSFLLRKYILCRINNYKENNIENENYIIKKISTYYVIPGLFANNYNNYWLYPIYCKNKKEILNRIDSKNINYVNKISQLVCIDKKCINSLDIMNNILFFPIHKLTSLENIKYIIDKLNKCK